MRKEGTFPCLFFITQDGQPTVCAGGGPRVSPEPPTWPESGSEGPQLRASLRMLSTPGFPSVGRQGNLFFFFPDFKLFILY